MTTFQQGAELVGDLADDLQDRLDDGVADEMEETAVAARRRVSANDSVASGRLLARLVHREQRRLASRSSVFAVHTVVAPEVYKYHEYGTGQRGRQSAGFGATFDRPSDGPYKAPNPMPPYEPIRRWVVEKGLTPDPDGPYDSQLELASAIQRTIGERGTYAHPFMRPTWFERERSVTRGAARAIRTATRRTF